MKIISPIDNLAEADLLLQAGAAELYGGFVPECWEKAFGRLASINQRTFDQAQIRSYEDLSTIVGKAHDMGRTFSLTLNAPFYDDSMLPMLRDYAESAIRAGVDGIILADLALLRVLKPLYPEIEFHASTLAHLSNSEAIRFYARQGIERAVIPRHISVEEISVITARVPEVSFDVFMLIGKCPNTEGLCTFHHASQDKVWPCEIPYDIQPLTSPVSPALRKAMEHQAQWSRSNRRHGCGLCAIPALARCRVDGLKLVGRGAPTQQKIANIRIVRDFVAQAKDTRDESAYRRRARQAHRKRFGADCSPHVCYYPEFYEAE